MALLRDVGAARAHALGSRCVIGRHRACDLRLDDPRVSSEHACLRWAGERWELSDLGSRNGTFVGGRRLRAGERLSLTEGAEINLGHAVELTLADASGPVASARHAASGARRVAIEGLLVLPDDDRPEVSLFEDASGRWVAESTEGTRPVDDRDVLVIDGEGWVLDLPNAAGATVEGAGLPPSIESLRLCLAVRGAGDRVEVTLIAPGQAPIPLPYRVHHHLLLALARARLAGVGPPEDRGWVDRDELCRALSTDDPRTLNLDVFRLRQQLGAAGVAGAAGIVERRADSGELRLGIDRIEIITI